MGFLRDSIWQSIGSIIGLVALCVTLIIFRAQNKRKKLSYEIITNSALIGESAKNELTNRIKITYAGKSVQNIRLVVFRIHNSGNVAILASEFETPIKIFFKEDSKILNANVVDTKPLNLQPIIEINKNQISIKPLLLNVNDEIIIKALIDNYSTGVNFTGRIVGIKEIEASGDLSFISSLPYYLFSIYVFGGVAGAQASIFLIAFLNSINGWKTPTVAESIFSLVFGLIMTFFAFGVIVYAFRKVKLSLS